MSAPASPDAASGAAPETLLLGQILDFTADPFSSPPEDSARHLSRGGIVLRGGRITEIGPAARLIESHASARRVDYGAALLLPGFVDAHAHYPQTGIIASWGKRLIDWLEGYTFPEESRFGDALYAATIAGRYLDLAIANGTTTIASFCTSHPESVTAFFQAAQARGMAVVGGKVAMDRNAPDALKDTPERAYDESKALLQRWHKQGRARYAITPRFTPTSTEAQLEAMGALWAEHPDCAMQTHLSEQVEEIAWVKELCPEAEDYLATYEKHRLIGPGALFGHAIHLTERERARLAESGSAVVHCPTSNTFIGSGVFDAAGLVAGGVEVGLATDTGGGSSFSMLRTMGAAYEISQLNGAVLHPAQLLWLATTGSAKALRMEAEVGTLAPGSAADIIALDLASTPAIAQRAARARDIWEALFPTMMMGDDRAVKAVWVNGVSRR
ncbi:guanine deaminase [Vannielia litorea]|uniref:guanine deaminase n=1 Tax=Vannielia litorea TaxID=1217970 RepID=UPI001C9760D1|nr:guanine deaminase [Vannielia litorea]MBY6152136.1 guanine deaminase [Vannielia litorea]